MILEEKIKKLEEENRELYKRLQSGRDYLMTISNESITVEECFVAFGWDENGF